MLFESSNSLRVKGSVSKTAKIFRFFSPFFPSRASYTLYYRRIYEALFVFFRRRRQLALYIDALKIENKININELVDEFGNTKWRESSSFSKRVVFFLFRLRNPTKVYHDDERIIYIYLFRKNYVYIYLKERDFLIFQ